MTLHHALPALVLLALAPDLARAQPAATAPVESAATVVGRVLTTARASGALSRVLGQHDLLMGPNADELYSIRVRVAEDGPAPTFILETELRGLRGQLGVHITTATTVGFDGQVQRFRSRTTSLDGVTRDLSLDLDLADGKLSGRAVSSAHGKPTREELVSVAATPDLVSPEVVCFALPMLFDQGVPDMLSMTELLVDGRTGPLVVTMSADAEAAGPVRLASVKLHGQVLEELRVAADGPRAGQVVSIRCDLSMQGGGWSARLLTPDEAAQLLAGHDR